MNYVWATCSLCGYAFHVMLVAVDTTREHHRNKVHGGDQAMIFTLEAS